VSTTALDRTVAWEPLAAALPANPAEWAYDRILRPNVILAEFDNTVPDPVMDAVGAVAGYVCLKMLRKWASGR
jgi:hypothetical protein